MERRPLLLLASLASLAACVTQSELANPCGSANQGLHTRAQNQQLLDACRRQQLATAPLPACEPDVDVECRTAVERREKHEADQLRRHQALSRGQDPDARPSSESSKCIEFRRKRAAFQAEVARDTEAAFQARKKEMQSVGEAEFFQARVDYWLDHGETLSVAVNQAWEESERRNTTRADGRSMSAFSSHVDCD